MDELIVPNVIPKFVHVCILIKSPKIVPVNVEAIFDADTIYTSLKYGFVNPKMELSLMPNGAGSYRTIDNNNCPYCSHQKILKGYNDLATTNPDLLQEWDYSLNNKLGIYPDCVFSGSHKKV